MRVQKLLQTLIFRGFELSRISSALPPYRNKRASTAPAYGPSAECCLRREAYSMPPPDTTNAISPSTSPWPLKDIVYVAIVGSVMLAALLEWVLWLLAFLYCLCKVFQKAQGDDKANIRVLAILNMLFFVCMRCIFLPIMIVTLPLPSQIVVYFPERMVSVLQWFAFWSFAGLLTMPWLFCIYQLVTHNVGRTRKIKTVLDEASAPKVVIILPCYNETTEILLRTVDSIVHCDYPPSCVHIFLSFDGDAENDLYLNTIEKLGVPLRLERYPRSIDVPYQGSRVTVSRFPHGGKRKCQKNTFKLIDKIYAEYLRRHDDLFLLFIDSDCILDPVCIQNFMYEMELKPGSKRDCLASTGVITSTTVKNSIITVLQDMEYIHGQLFERSVESGCGAVTCLPGALTILRFSAFRRMAKYYFADKAEQCDDLFDFGKCHLGEDRWLTHLFMIGAKKRFQIQMNTGAFCKTEAVQTFKSLLKQRRRWFLGFITNEACMLTDIRLWRRYPLLLIIRLAQDTIRTTALLFFIMVISIISTSQKIANLPVGFIAVSLGLNWVLMLYFGAKLGRYKIMLYPLMFVLNPFMNWTYMVYGIFTAGQRTWGGPRADAAAADERTSPEEAVEMAVKQGDELNVVPESFKPALETTRRRVPHHAPLLPSVHLAGRFVPSTSLPGGWYRQDNDSGVLYADMTPRQREHGMGRPTGNRRDSEDSIWSQTSNSEVSIHTPRRVASLLEMQRALALEDEQAGDNAYVKLERDRGQAWSNAPVFRNTPRAPSEESARSTGSESSVSLHFGIPRRRSDDIPTRKRSSSPPPTVVARGRPLHRPHSSHPPVSLAQQNDIVTRARTSTSLNRQSPLARKSFTKLADELSSAGDAASLRRRHSVAGEGRRGRRSISVDAHGRRRLSKQRPGSNAEKRAESK